MVHYNPEKHALSNSYYSLAILQLLTLLYPLWFTFIPAPRIVMGVLLTLISISAVYSATNTHAQLKLGTGIAAVAIALEWLSVINGINFAQNARLIVYSILFIFLFYHIFRQLFNSKEVDERLIVAAIVNFIILGFLGSMMVQFIINLNEHAFSGITINSLDNYSFFYYSFITLTSVGYGDIAPISAEARSIAVVLSIIGQAYFAIIVALIVGKYLSSHS